MTVKENIQIQTQVGDIFVNTFGYTMTLQEFLQVVEKRGKKLTLKKLNKQHRPTGFMQYDVRPIKDSFASDKTITKIIKVNEFNGKEYLSMGKYDGYAYKVDDLSKWYSENHAD